MMLHNLMIVIAWEITVKLKAGEQTGCMQVMQGVPIGETYGMNMQMFQEDCVGAWQHDSLGSAVKFEQQACQSCASSSLHCNGKG